MTTVANYLPGIAPSKPNTPVLAGTIKTGGDIDVEFILGGMPATGLKNDCVLGFMAQSENSSNLKVEARLNGGNSPIFTYGPTSTNITRFFQQIFDGLKAGDNHITFKIVGGTGSFSITNLVIWYRIDV